MSEAQKEALEVVRVKVEEVSLSFNLNLRLVQDQCDNGQQGWIIRQEGCTTGGMVVVLVADNVDEERIAKLVEMLTPAFFNSAMVRSYQKSGKMVYLDPDQYKGTPVIKISGDGVYQGYQYWSHVLQCVWIR